MNNRVLFSVFLMLSAGICVVRAGEPDPSFSETLTSFLNSLFGSDNTTTTSPSGPDNTTATPLPEPTPETPESGQATTGTAVTAVATNNATSNITTNSGQANLSTKQETNLATTENDSNTTSTVQMSNSTFKQATDSTTSSQTSPKTEVSAFGTDVQTDRVESVTESSYISGTFRSTFSYPKTSTYASSSTLETRPEMTSSQCFEDTVIQNFCVAPSDLTDVSFWDLYSAIYSDSVLDGLMMACVRGTWCLQDKYDYWDALIAERVDIVMNSEIVNSTCQPGVLGCLDNMAKFFNNCSFYYQMVYATESIDLLCKMKSNPDLTDGCYKHVIEALHVTLADLARERSQQQDYVEQESGDTCDTPEAYMTQGLICIANSCPGEADTFKSFRPWAWFTNIVDELISECRYNITECVALLQMPEGYMRAEDLQMMITISISTMVTAILMSLTVCICYRRYRRNAVIKDGYQQLLNDGDES